MTGTLETKVGTSSETPAEGLRRRVRPRGAVFAQVAGLLNASGGFALGQAFQTAFEQDARAIAVGCDGYTSACSP